MRIIRKTQCSGCRKYFIGDTAFFAHRTGSFDARTRRCLSTEEMQAAGYATESVLVNMYLDGKPIREEHDAWFEIAARERVRKAFGKQTDEDEEEDNDDA